MTKVSIHQPNFIPWLGYFQKIIASDIHVILDDVQARRSAGTWTNRVKIASEGKERWLTIPLTKSQKKSEDIRELRACEGWADQVLSQIEARYRRSPHFKLVIEFLQLEFDNATNSICEFNIRMNDRIFEFMEMPKVRTTRSSEFNLTTSGTERLRDLVANVGGSTYLCGTGSDGYLVPEMFSAVGQDLEYLLPSLPSYSQVGSETFIPGLSIIDALFNVGPSVTRKLVTKEP